MIHFTLHISGDNTNVDDEHPISADSLPRRGDVVDIANDKYITRCRVTEIVWRNGIEHLHLQPQVYAETM